MVITVTAVISDIPKLAPIAIQVLLTMDFCFTGLFSVLSETKLHNNKELRSDWKEKSWAEER